jgi:hypothetical protein
MVVEEVCAAMRFLWLKTNFDTAIASLGVFPLRGKLTLLE